MNQGRPARDGSRDVFVNAAIDFLAGRARLAGRLPSGSKGGSATRDAQPRAEALGIRLVAELAGRSAATPLFHFPDRTCLMAAVAAKGFDLLVGHLRLKGFKVDGSVAAGVALRYVEWGMDNVGLFTAMYDPSLGKGLELAQLDASRLEERFRDFGDSAHVAGKRARVFRDLLNAKVAALECFAEAVAQDQRDDSIRTTDKGQVAHTLTALADGLVWQWITERQGTALGMLRHAEQCLRLLRRGLRA